MGGEPPAHARRAEVSRILSRRVLLVAALLCGAPAVPAGPPAAPPAMPGHPVLEDVRPAPEPAQRAAPPPVQTAPTAALPSRQPVIARRVAVRVEGVGPDAARTAAGVAGVVHATTVRVGRLAVGAGPDQLTVAAVDPVGYRPFAPQVVADTVGVWERLDEGAAAVTHEHAQRLRLQLGGDVVLGGVDGVPVRVGAFASNGVPPVAQAIVARETGSRLGLDQVAPLLLVAVADAVPADQVAADLQRLLGREATVVPDPRAPGPVTPAPPQGSTVWDVLAGCESSGDWHVNTGNGYYGGLQFLPESWWLVGGTGMPHEATREEQIRRAELLLARQGWQAWPVCSIKVGLRPDPAAT